VKIVDTTELMKNQKHVVVMPPDEQFDVLQTQDGDPLFFSIGADNIFYCTYEVPNSTTSPGWVRVDLSSQLSANYNNAQVTAKSFDIAQDIASKNVSLILVVTVNGQDYLYTSLNNPNSETGWSSSPLTWTNVPYDNIYNASPIADVYLAQINTETFIIADIVNNVESQTIFRYYVDTTVPSVSPYGYAWVAHDVSSDLQAGSITNALGCGPNQQPQYTIDGVYTLGSIDGVSQLLYTPVFNLGDPGGPGQPTIFTIPTGVTPKGTALALSVPNPSTGLTDMYLAGANPNDPTSGCLYFLPNSQQTHLSTPICIYTDPLLLDVQNLHVNTWNGQTVVWGLNAAGKAFIMECVVGQEMTGVAPGVNGSAWQAPIPILFSALNVATYINNQLNNSVIFANMQDGTLIQLFQDPVTTAWQQRSILLQAPTPDEIYTYQIYSYSTHIEITDDNNIVQPNYAVSITATSPCSVYINDVYCNLSTTTPLSLTTDFSGVLTIVQEIDTLGGVCYNVTAGDASVNINPLTGTTDTPGPAAKLSQVTTGSDININVTDEYGDSSPLMNSQYVSQADDVATNINQVSQALASMPPDGTLQPAAQSTSQLAADVRFDPSKDKVFGISFENNQARHFEGLEAAAAMGIHLQADNMLLMGRSSAESLESLRTLEAKAGHMFRWMKSEATKAVKMASVVIKDVGGDVLKDIYHFYITMENAVYHFVIQCISDVLNTIHSILNSIATAFENMVQWLGMIFSFGDILRTHAVLKNVVNIFVSYATTNLSTLSSELTDVFNSAKAELDPKTGLPPGGAPSSDQTYSTTMAASTPPAGSKSPSANYGTHHLKSNASSSDNDYTTTYSPDASIFQDLLTLLEQEGQAMNQLVTQLQTDLADFNSLSVTEIITRVMQDIIGFALSTGENILQFAVNILEQMLSKVTDVLNATIHIPVLTWFYKKMTTTQENPSGDDLTPLDLFCLLSAIPSTVIFKAVKSVAPFPEGPQTTAILEATDMASLQQALGGTSSVSSEANALGADQNGFTPLNIVGSIAATVGAIVIDLVVTVKSYIPPTTTNPVEMCANKVFSVINSVGYMGYVLPDMISAVQTLGATKTNYWAVTMSNLCTLLAIPKSIIDASSAWWGGRTWGLFMSPGLEYVLNVAWQIPTTVLFVEEFKSDKAALGNEIAAFIGGTSFDFGGILAVPLAIAMYGQSVTAITATVAAIDAANLVWAGSNLATTFDGQPIPTPPQSN
jgi:hypothetical protein